MTDAPSLSTTLCNKAYGRDSPATREKVYFPLEPRAMRNFNIGVVPYKLLAASRLEGLRYRKVDRKMLQLAEISPEL